MWININFAKPASLISTQQAHLIESKLEEPRVVNSSHYVREYMHL